MSRLSVDGHDFHTRGDYEAALRDKKKIDCIRKETDLLEEAQVFELYQRIGDGMYHFESILGREFDDEIYELNEELQKQKRQNPQRQNPKIQNSKVQNSKAQKQNKTVRLEDYDEKMQEQILLELKKREKRRKIVVSLCMCIACLSLGYLVIYSYMGKRTEEQAKQWSQLKENAGEVEVKVPIHKENKQEVKKEILEEYKNLYNLNKKLIGWLTIDDTLIDYPVMQTSNNEYYLDHNFDQKYDKNGSIFMDAECDALDRNMNLILYGHNMKSGKMFGSLKNYQKESYYKEHPTIKFDTIYDKGVYQIMYVFPSKVYTEDKITFKYYQFFDAVSEDEFYSNMEEMKKISFYDTSVKAQYGDELLTLSTCDSNESDSRFVVVAKKIK